ncbi:MAG: replication restart helicase PriA, partial [Oscillospiraceae bacterium]
MVCYLLKVAVENATFTFDEEYSYLSEYYVEKFSRVLVPFGRANMDRKGVVLDCKEVEDNKDYQNIKSIKNVISNEPLSNELIELIFYVKEKYLSTYYDALKLIVPKGVDGDAVLKLNVIDFSNKDFRDEDKFILEVIIKEKGFLKKQFLKDNKKLIDKLLKLNVIEKEYIIKNKIKANGVYTYGLKEDMCIDINLTKKQQQVIDIIKEKGFLSYKEIYYYTKVGKTVLNNLCKKDILQIKEEQFDTCVDLKGKNSFYLLNQQQTNGFNKLKEESLKQKFSKNLLFGVTGSGKTVVYIKFIEFILQQKKSVILTVPELALTPQIINIFKNNFGETVAFIHSNLSVGERVKQYNKIKTMKQCIVIGTRSALFAPINNLGAIIIDEEQDNSYYSDQNPRYSAKDIAQFRCKYNEAVLVFGSATPSVNTFYQSEKSLVNLITLDNRYKDSKMPETTIIDMKDEIKNGNTSSISRFLIEEIKKEVNKNNQVILLVNRRGYDTSLVCADCFTTLKCKKCSVNLIYHKANKKLMCHHCGYISDKESCSECDGKEFLNNGFGTQKIEDEISNYVNNAKIIRMDLDTTGSKFSHDKYFKDFKDKKYNVLIGTQMISKGLDFADVTLVGILNVESVLN